VGEYQEEKEEWCLIWGGIPVLIANPIAVSSPTFGGEDDVF